ncbi:hypothetical protein AB3N58_04035 [Leptospira sp. WS60.C2]
MSTDIPFISTQQSNVILNGVSIVHKKANLSVGFDSNLLLYPPGNNAGEKRARHLTQSIDSFLEFKSPGNAAQ